MNVPGNLFDVAFAHISWERRYGTDPIGKIDVVVKRALKRKLASQPRITPSFDSLIIVVLWIGIRRVLAYVRSPHYREVAPHVVTDHRGRDVSIVLTAGRQIIRF